MADIRPLTAADVPACAALMSDTPLWRRYGVTGESAAARFRSGLAEGVTILVAEDAGVVAGFVWCVVRGAFDRSGYIPLIGVRPGLVGGNIGAELLDAAERFFVLSCQDVFLLVSDFNVGAQRFYQRHGYRQVGALADYVKPGITELLYWKRLSAG
jgi:ribosomal protein S18 acetylase RimI-like enzyme